jgi:hypothetical protein
MPTEMTLEQFAKAALKEANRASFSIKSKKLEGTLVEVAFPPTRVLAE